MIKTNSDFTRRNIIYKGLVIGINDDPTGYKPIRCRIESLDDEIKDGDLAPCYPILPKHINVYPKVGEYVYIIMLEIKEGSVKSNQEKRYFIGPVVSTFPKLEADYDDDAESDSPIKPTLTNPDKGVYPKKEWISIQGRENSDLIFRPQEVILRAGKYVQGKPLKFNNKDMAYIQIRYGNPRLTKTTKKVPVTTVTLPTFDGFVTANIIDIGSVSCNVRIILEDKNHNFLGKIVQTYNIAQRNEAVNFVHDTYLNLKQNKSETLKLIKDDNGTNLPVSYDLSKFKYINNSIPELKDFDINPKTEKVITYEDKEVQEVIFDGSNGSVTNIVSNQINLISHANKENFKLLDPEQNITAEEQIKINSESHPIPKGDDLVDFLQLLRTVVANHVHPYPGLPSDKDSSVQQLLYFNLESLLNKNVRTG